MGVGVYQDLGEIVSRGGEGVGAPLAYSYAVAEAVEKVTDWDACRRVIPLTVLSEEAVQKRFHYGDWEGLYLFLIRVYALPVPLDLPHKPSYDGCKSWVPQETSMFTAGSLPVIPEGAWPYTHDKILKVLKG